MSKVTRGGIGETLPGDCVGDGDWEGEEQAEA
jgi:hypothetical protein